MLRFTAVALGLMAILLSQGLAYDDKVIDTKKFQIQDATILKFDKDINRNFEKADLVESIEDCAVVADACSFIIKEKKFIIEAKSLNSARSEFSEDEAKIQAEECRSRYSLEYLSKFIKGAKLCDKTILQFANDHPLKMKFKTEHMELGFVLAPRVETED